MKKGDKISGHFCYGCLSSVDAPVNTEKNQPKTDWCIKCGHRSEGLLSTGLVGDWLIIGKSTCT